MRKSWRSPLKSLRLNKLFRKLKKLYTRKCLSKLKAKAVALAKEEMMTIVNAIA